jgi:hypothetical protein
MSDAEQRPLAGKGHPMTDFDDSPYGLGATEQDAIDDLMAQLEGATE